MTTSRPQLLLVPGLLCDRDLWRDQIAALQDDWDITVPLLNQHTTMASMARAAVAPLGGRPFALAGLSMGGHISFEIMRQFGHLVTHLALLDTSARADSPEQSETRRALISLAEVGQFKGVTDRLLPRLIHHGRLTDTALTNRVKAMAQTVGREGFFNQQRAIISRIDSRASLFEIKCPTLVVCGAEDSLTPPELSVEIFDAIQGSVLEIIPTCGHLSTMERPEAVTKALSTLLAA